MLRNYDTKHTVPETVKYLKHKAKINVRNMSIKKKGQFNFVIIGLVLLAVLAIVVAYELGDKRVFYKHASCFEFTKGASYAAHIEHFTGTLTAFDDYSWTVDTEEGSVRIVNDARSSPIYTLRGTSFTPNANETSSFLRVGDRVTIYSLIPFDTKRRMVTGISAERRPQTLVPVSQPNSQAISKSSPQRP